MSDQTPHDEQPAESAESRPAEDAAAEQAVPQAADEPQAEPVAEVPVEEAPAAEEPATDAAPTAGAPDADASGDDDEDDEPVAPRVKPLIPGADLEVDIVLEGEEQRGPDRYGDDEDLPEGESGSDDDQVVDEQPITATIELAADARYRATGKRKTAIARVILKPGTGQYTINGRTLDEFFPRPTLQRTIRQPLETVGYEDRMDVIARMHGGGVSAQAGALRHGISRALLEADPNLRSELKRRGFLTRDARVKERKKAGLKKARKRPQFSKR
jgi:small subunit ribosomal protein S9